MERGGTAARRLLEQASPLRRGGAAGIAEHAVGADRPHAGAAQLVTELDQRPPITCCGQLAPHDRRIECQQQACLGAAGVGIPAARRNREHVASPTLGPQPAQRERHGLRVAAMRIDEQ